MATAGRHSLLGLHWLTDFFLLITDLSDYSDSYLKGVASVISDESVIKIPVPTSV